MKGLLKDTLMLKTFTKQCLLNESARDYKDSIHIIKKYWEQAVDIEDFKRLVFKDERLLYNQGYAELSKESDYHHERILKMLAGRKKIITSSDVGSVKVGNEHFSVNIPNGCGDGLTEVYIVSKNEVLSEDMLRSLGLTLHGKINIFSYDCGKKIEHTINGNYFVFNFENNEEGAIVLKEY